MQFTQEEQKIIDLFKVGFSKIPNTVASVHASVDSSPDFQEIEQAGKKALRPLFYVLLWEEFDDDWALFYIILKILGEDAPKIPNDKKGRHREIKDILIKFGREKGYLS